MRLLIFGLGYTAGAIAARVGAARVNGVVVGTTRDGRGGTLRFDDRAAVLRELATATHVLASVPPADGVDPVLAAYRDALSGAGAGARAWLGYLSSTGVYGDAAGAWVDEATPTGRGRRGARTEADAAWLALGARVFRLPGIYGPGRSALDRVAEGKAHRTCLPDQVFSRCHVDDIASGVIAAFDAPAGAYNLADDLPCSQDLVVMFAADLIGMPPPPVVALETLSRPAQAFYAENRRVANGKAKRVLGWQPAYPDYRAGLRAVRATTSPTPASPAPNPASGDQR